MNIFTQVLSAIVSSTCGRLIPILSVSVWGLSLSVTFNSLAQVPPPVAVVQSDQSQVPLPQTELKVVGGLSTRLNYVEVEQTFWGKTLAERSAGKVTAQIKGFDELGIKGAELLRLMSQGVIEFGVVPLSYYQSVTPLLEAVDIAGLVTDTKLARDSVLALKPVFSHYLESAHQSKLLGISPYMPQVFFCNRAIRNLADLRGLTIRTASRMQAELIEALGAKSITLPFRDVLPALTDQSVACAIASSMAGYQAKWYRATTHLYLLPVGWNQELHAVNKKAWESLDSKVQDFLTPQIDQLIESLWMLSEKLTKTGNDCNGGSKECLNQLKGQMTLVQPTASDLASIKSIAVQKVLPLWISRCSDSCVADFNQTIGKLLNIVVKK